MTADTANKLNEIWKDDLLGRRAEAQLLADYVESVAERQLAREDVRSFTLAIDVGYGEGKTFFLRRLAEQLKINHPVAFVDAWADDVADDPLTALAATLEKALEPLRDQPGIKENLENVVAKAGEVAKVALVGAAKRGLSLLITEGAAEAVSGLIKSAPQKLQGAADEAANGVGDDVVNALFAGVAPGALMQGRIDAFETGKGAIQDLKTNLSKLVEALDGKGLSPPIAIVIDELDRCRPTYAIKLLEEIKHLFDVPGVVFIFGMHGEQLGHSIGAAYGPHFKGKEYLRRFIGRRYQLKVPKMKALLAHSLSQAGLINSNQLNPYFYIASHGFGPDRPALDDLIARYMEMYRLPAREAFSVVDALQTCAAIVPDQTLQLPYLLPLLMSKLAGADGGLMQPPITPDWDFVFFTDMNVQQTMSPWQMANELHSRFVMSKRDLGRLEDGNPITSIAWGMSSNTRGLGDPSRYPELLEAVGRFDNVEAD